MFHIIKNSLNEVLSKLTGYRICRSGTVPDLRNNVSDPREGIYHAKSFPFIMDLPVNLARNWRWFCLTEKSSSPFYVATKRYLKSGDNEQGYLDIHETIKDYAKLSGVSNPIESLGLLGLRSYYKENMHPLQFVLPWDVGTPLEFYNSWRKNTLYENKEHGIDSDDFLGALNCSKEKIELEINRLHKLILSIQEKGFISTPDNYFGAIIMVDSFNNYVWYVRGGQHRSSILAAMGWKHLPVKVSQIVYRDEVAFWPAVTAGYYSQDAALKVFDRIFNADPPPVNQNWIEKVKSYKAN